MKSNAQVRGRERIDIRSVQNNDIHVQSETNYTFCQRVNQWNCKNHREHTKKANETSSGAMGSDNVRSKWQLGIERSMQLKNSPSWRSFRSHTHTTRRFWSCISFLIKLDNLMNFSIECSLRDYNWGFLINS